LKSTAAKRKNKKKKEERLSLTFAAFPNIAIFLHKKGNATSLFLPLLVYFSPCVSLSFLASQSRNNNNKRLYAYLVSAP